MMMPMLGDGSPLMESITVEILGKFVDVLGVFLAEISIAHDGRIAHADPKLSFVPRVLGVN
jgi:hypothetical protein